MMTDTGSRKKRRRGKRRKLRKGQCDHKFDKINPGGKRTKMYRVRYTRKQAYHGGGGGGAQKWGKKGKGFEGQRGNFKVGVL